MTKDQTVAIMAAAIYAIRMSSNPKRHRLDTLRREAVAEAEALCEYVKHSNG